jgi:hypothetical protein
MTELSEHSTPEYLTVDHVHNGDCRELLPRVQPDSIALSVWSPPYYVGKDYERDLGFAQWQSLLQETIGLLFPVIKPGFPGDQHRGYLVLQGRNDAQNYGRERIEKESQLDH